jgi:hypothetical protein
MAGSTRRTKPRRKLSAADQKKLRVLVGRHGEARVARDLAHVSLASLQSATTGHVPIADSTATRIESYLRSLEAPPPAEVDA